MRPAALAAACLTCLLAAASAPAPAAAAPRPHVVVLVLDEFPTTSLLGRHRRIDGGRFPHFAALAGDSTWFRNATTISDSTFASVPAILDGRDHRWKPGDRLRPPRRTLMDYLSRRGYRVSASAEGGACPRRWCGRPRPTRYYLVRQRMPRVRQFLNTIQPSRRPRLWFKHTLLPHVPWMYLPTGHQYLRSPFTPVRGINSELGVHSRTLVRFSYQRHLLQVAAVDHLIGQLVDRLKRQGMYDRTMLVITADHGVSFRLHEEDRRALTRGNVQAIAPVPLFVKRPGQRRGRVSRSYARVYDVLPTIADVLNRRVPWRTRGRSAFSRAVARRRTIRVRGRDRKRPVVRMSTRRFQGRWGRAIRYQHAVFGFGGFGRRFFGLEPSRFLIKRRLLRDGRGLKLGRLRVRGRGRLRARIYRSFEFRQVRFRRARFRPTLVAGRILGSRRPRGGRTIVVVVNGFAAAVTRTFRLRGRRREQFAALFHEAVLKPGRNSVQIVSVGRRGKRLRGRLLGGF